MSGATGIRLVVLLGIALAAGVVIGASAGRPGGGSGSASAIAVSLSIPGSAAIDGGASSSAAAAEAGGEFRYPEDGSVISIAGFASSAAAAEGANVAQAVVDIAEVSLFAGEVVVSGVAGRARARAEGGRVIADTAGSRIASITALGRQVDAAAGSPVPVGDWALLTVGSVETQGADAQRQIVLQSIRLTLTAEHRGLPAGTEIVLGTAIAELQIPSEEPADVATTTAPGERSGRTRPSPAPPEKTPRKPRRQGRQAPFAGPPDLDVTPQLTKQGYVFPISGQAWFSSTFGAARANTGWHHGTDVFAPFGAPVLAIADGTLFSVGWNKVGGYRLWLRDRQGNQFYYAHLAAYSALTKEGREVKAGQVIGFNGNTGDAQGTPFHVHFEVHPVGLLPMGYDGVVDPYRYLLAWRRLEDVSLTVGTGWAPPVKPTAQAPRPAAFLLQASDISSASGLEAGALERALTAELPTGSDGLPAPAASCAECEASRP